MTEQPPESPSFDKNSMFVKHLNKYGTDFSNLPQAEAFGSFKNEYYGKLYKKYLERKADYLNIPRSESKIVEIQKLIKENGVFKAQAIVDKTKRIQMVTNLSQDDYRLPFLLQDMEFRLKQQLTYIRELYDDLISNNKIMTEFLEDDMHLERIDSCNSDRNSNSSIINNNTYSMNSKSSNSISDLKSEERTAVYQKQNTISESKTAEITNRIEGDRSNLALEIAQKTLKIDAQVKQELSKASKYRSISMDRILDSNSDLGDNLETKAESISSLKRDTSKNDIKLADVLRSSKIKNSENKEKQIFEQFKDEMTKTLCQRYKNTSIFENESVEPLIAPRVCSVAIKPIKPSKSVLRSKEADGVNINVANGTPIRVNDSSISDRKDIDCSTTASELPDHTDSTPNADNIFSSVSQTAHIAAVEDLQEIKREILKRNSEESKDEKTCKVDLTPKVENESVENCKINKEDSSLSIDSNNRENGMFRMSFCGKLDSVANNPSTLHNINISEKIENFKLDEEQKLSRDDIVIPKTFDCNTAVNSYDENNGESYNYLERKEDSLQPSALQLQSKNNNIASSSNLETNLLNNTHNTIDSYKNECYLISADYHSHKGNKECISYSPEKEHTNVKRFKVSEDSYFTPNIHDDSHISDDLSQVKCNSNSNLQADKIEGQIENTEVKEQSLKNYVFAQANNLLEDPDYNEIIEYSSPEKNTISASDYEIAHKCHQKTNQNPISVIDCEKPSFLESEVQSSFLSNCPNENLAVALRSKQNDESMNNSILPEDNLQNDSLFNNETQITRENASDKKPVVSAVNYDASISNISMNNNITVKINQLDNNDELLKKEAEDFERKIAIFNPNQLFNDSTDTNTGFLEQSESIKASSLSVPKPVNDDVLNKHSNYSEFYQELKCQELSTTSLSLFNSNKDPSDPINLDAHKAYMPGISVSNENLLRNSRLIFETKRSDMPVLDSGSKNCSSVIKNDVIENTNHTVASDLPDVASNRVSPLPYSVHKTKLSFNICKGEGVITDKIQIEKNSLNSENLSPDISKASSVQVNSIMEGEKVVDKSLIIEKKQALMAPFNQIVNPNDSLSKSTDVDKVQDSLDINIPGLAYFCASQMGESKIFVDLEDNKTKVMNSQDTKELKVNDNAEINILKIVDSIEAIENKSCIIKSTHEELASNLNSEKIKDQVEQKPKLSKAEKLAMLLKQSSFAKYLSRSRY